MDQNKRIWRALTFSLLLCSPIAACTSSPLVVGPITLSCAFLNHMVISIRLPDKPLLHKDESMDLNVKNSDGIEGSAHPKFASGAAQIKTNSASSRWQAYLNTDRLTISYRDSNKRLKKIKVNLKPYRRKIEMAFAACDSSS